MQSSPAPVRTTTDPLLQSVKKTWGKIWKFKVLYLLALPGLFFFILFKYVPLLGIVIAFKDYNIFKGIADSPWVGLKHFNRMFEYGEFSLF